MMAQNLLQRFLTVLVTILTFFLLLFVYTKVAGPIPFDINSVTTNKSEAFIVTGEGKVEVKPDSATVRLGVATRALNAEAAKNDLNTKIGKVIEAIKALGVEDKNIKTDNFNIYPEYGDTNASSGGTDYSDQNKITGYSANTNLTVTVSTADLANKVVDAGVGAGANQVGGIDFQVKDKDVALNQAREMAVADAKKKAENVANIAGFKLGKVINYSESQNGFPVPMLMKAEDARGGSMNSTNVQPGQEEIALSVTLSYEIK